LPSSGRTSVFEAMRDRIGTPTLNRRDRAASSFVSTEDRLSGQSGLQVNEGGSRRRKTSLESVNQELRRRKQSIREMLSPLTINRSVSSNSLTTFDEAENEENEKKKMSLPNAGAVSPTPRKKRRQTLRRSMTLSLINFISSSNPTSPRPNSSKPTSPTPESQGRPPKFQASMSWHPEPPKIVTQASTPTSPDPAKTLSTPTQPVPDDDTPDSPETPTNDFPFAWENRDTVRSNPAFTYQ